MSNENEINETQDEPKTEPVVKKTTKKSVKKSVSKESIEQSTEQLNSGSLSNDGSSESKKESVSTEKNEDIKSEKKKSTKKSKEDSEKAEYDMKTVEIPINYGSFVFGFNDIDPVKKTFEAVNSLLTEVRLIVNKEVGVNITSMDGSHICLCCLTIHPSDMDIFECKENSEIGVNLDDLVKIIKRGNSSDTISFHIDEKNKRLVITFKTEKKKPRTFTLSLIDIDTEQIDMKTLREMEFPSRATIENSYLIDVIKDAEIYSEVITLKSKEDELINFSAEGTNGDVSQDIGEDELEDPMISDSEGVSYAIQFLQNIAKMFVMNKKLRMNFGFQMPLNIIIKLFKNSEVFYMLAPRVEEENPDNMYDDE